MYVFLCVCMCVCVCACVCMCVHVCACVCMLEVETGRWQKKEREERLCSLCHKAVGDISHFLSECEALDGERKALKSILRDVTNETFASEVLNSIKDNRVVKEVVKMWRFREDLLV